VKEILKGTNRTNGSPFSTRIYATPADRARALKQLRKRYNYFVPYRDVQGHALSIGVADWKPTGEYICPD